MMKFETAISCRRTNSMFVQVSFMNEVDLTLVAPVHGVEPAEVVIEVFEEVLEIAGIKR